jgi:hypothetical protein
MTLLFMPSIPSAGRECRTWSLAPIDLCGLWCYSIFPWTPPGRGTPMPSSESCFSGMDLRCSSTRCTRGTVRARRMRRFTSTACRTGCRMMGRCGSSPSRTNSSSGCGFFGEKCESFRQPSRSNSNFSRPAFGQSRCLQSVARRVSLSNPGLQAIRNNIVQLLYRFLESIQPRPASNPQQDGVMLLPTAGVYPTPACKQSATMRARAALSAASLSNPGLQAIRNCRYRGAALRIESIQPRPASNPQRSKRKQRVYHRVYPTPACKQSATSLLI